MLQRSTPRSNVAQHVATEGNHAGSGPAAAPDMAHWVVRQCIHCITGLNPELYEFVVESETAGGPLHPSMLPSPPCPSVTSSLPALPSRPSLQPASARIGWAQSIDAGVLQSLQQSGADPILIRAAFGAVALEPFALHVQYAP